MNTDPEDFDALKKLLSLKRHEQPPPGYFNQLPGKIWTRIEANEARPSFWRRIFSGLALRPAVAYGFGLVVCGTLIFGIGSALKQPEQVGGPIVVQQQPTQLAPMTPALAEKGPGITSPESSTNPVIPGPFPRLNVQPAGFNP